MSLKGCVIHIAGDITKDMFSPQSWTERGGTLDKKKIESWVEARGMKMHWDKMDQSVTHLVVSRAVYRNGNDAVQFVLKQKRGKNSAYIVTYDWLEDSLDDNKAIRDVSAYDPGKPRDIPAILKARHKRRPVKRKAARERDAPESTKKPVLVKKEHPALSSKAEDETPPEEPAFSASESEQMPASDGNQFSGKAVAESSPSEPSPSKSSAPEQSLSLSQPKTPKPNLPKSGLSKASLLTSTSWKPPPNLSNLPPDSRNTPVVAETWVPATVKQDPVLSWKRTSGPRDYQDKLDKFVYNITLKHKNFEQNGEFWVLSIQESTKDPTTKTFLFSGRRYEKGSTTPTAQESRNPVFSSRDALKYFAESFRKRMGYNWDERLLRADGVQPGNWRYDIRADGKNGSTPSEYTPGHPRCKKLEELAPIRGAEQGQRATQTSLSRRPGASFPSSQRDNRAGGKRLIDSKASIPSGQVRAKQGILGGLDSGRYVDKARKVATSSTSLKRKAADSLAGRYSKVTKLNSTSSKSKFKSNELVDLNDDSDQEMATVSQRKPKP